jgi:hypothetical protein
MTAQESVDFLVNRLRWSGKPRPDATKPAFWLGAGCSAHDGVPVNAELLVQVLAGYPETWGSPQFLFDRLCNALVSPQERAGLLAPYMKKDIKPDSPYHDLRQVLVHGYADVVFTFNIDNLLEQALAAAGLREHADYLVVNVPELRPEAASAQIDPGSGGPRIRVVKLHGGYEWGINYMTSSEVTRYGERIHDVVRLWSSRPAVVCGYSFLHLNVLHAFSPAGGPLFYANPEFPSAPMILSLMAARNSGNQMPLFIDGELGTFATLMTRLRRDLCDDHLGA